MSIEIRPNPEALLKVANSELTSKGKLRIFLGMSAGVGKTYAMLEAAAKRISEGRKVLIGIVETHGRKETEALARGIPILPRKKIPYKDAVLEEFDLDACLEAAPEIVLLDELAHTNAPGSKHQKRHQDVETLLSHGIDVYTTLNVQHLESRKDLVEQITGVKIHETVPDSMLEVAEQVSLVDITPADLIKRLSEGKVYLGDKAGRAMENFFKADYLTALREIALRLTAEKVEHDLQLFAQTKRAEDPWPASERLMVAVSHSPHSEKLIRSTRRLAYNLDAPWIAVYVDTGALLSEADQSPLGKNLAWARQLGAEVVTLRESDVVEALGRVSVQKNVTQVVVGRPIGSRIFEFVNGGSLLDRFIKRNWKVDIHVIRQEHVQRTLTLKPFWESLRHHFFSYWNTLWFFLGLALMSGLAEPLIGYRAIGFVFLLGVLTVGFASSSGPVLFAAFLSTVLWNILFIPPRFTFVIREAEDIMMCLSYFVVAATVGLLTQKIRNHERLIRDQEEQSQVLLKVLQDLSENPEPHRFVKKILGHLALALKGNLGVLLRDFKTGYGSIYQSENETAVARWVMSSGSPAGWSTETLSQSKALYLPLKGKDQVVGVLSYEPENHSKLSLSQEALLFSVCRQLTQGLERAQDREKLREAEKVKESERLAQTLLSSVSHEIRTPLTALMGAASAIVDTSEGASRQVIAEELLRSSHRLNQVVENLLDMTRLSAGKLELKKEWNDPRDLVGVVLKRLEKTLERHRVEVRFDGDVPLVEFDFRLFEHVLSNILMNAAMYAPLDSQIVISGRITGVRPSMCFELTVEDSGPGIPQESLQLIFDKFYRAPNSPAGGSGLGLSIVKNIVDLHQGRVWAENRPEGGAKLIVELPIGDPPKDPPVTELESSA